MRRPIATLALAGAAALFATSVLAQDAPTSTNRDAAPPAPPAPTPVQPAPPAPPPAMTRIKGVIQSVDGDQVTVTQDTGPVTLTLRDQTVISQLKAIPVSAIQPGSFIGTANVDRPDGFGSSTEVHVFPPDMKGTGEGHYPMPGANSMMTNGDVTNVVTSAAGQELDIAYSGRGGVGTRHVLVPPGTPVVAITRVDRSALKPGVAVSAFAVPTSDGLAALGVNLGEDGKPPPL